MATNLEYKKLNSEELTEEQFKNILEVEQSDGDDCYSEETLRNIWFERATNDNFVCIANNKIVGCINFNPLSQRRNGSIYMINLMILPEYRKNGIATNLIKEACEYYLGKGCKKVMSLNVEKDNYKAINLYKKVGFEIREPVCEADEDDEQYVMDCHLEEIINTIRSLY
jgi:ribosomal protein S18 acetylase RimI-like enzyme